MTNTQEAFKKWFYENREIYNTNSTYDLMFMTWQANQANNDAVIAGLVEALAWAMQNIDEFCIDATERHAEHDKYLALIAKHKKGTA